MASSRNDKIDAAEQQFEVYWPRSPRQAQIKPLAKRLETLNGKTIAQLWDFLYRGDKVFTLLEEGIRSRYPEVRFVTWREFGSIHGTGAPEVTASLSRRFKELGVDAVIAGMGC